MQNVLEIKDLNLSFKIQDIYYPAIKGVNFCLKKGALHAIVGESGCGKTMSMMSILKLLPKNSKITKGKILFKGQNLLDFTDKEMQKIRGAKIALIPQDPMTSLNPLYTIENQLLEIILLHNKISKKEAFKLAKEKLKDVEIKDVERVLKSYPHELSGGMKQRIIIAMALVVNAEIIIADEPTTALDVTVQAQILKLLEEIKNKGTSIILITHNLALVAKYADEVSVMYLGEIVEKSSVRELFQNPKHPYTKALIEALPTFKNKKLKNLKGQPSPITEKISGCLFHPRCEACLDICKNEIPPLIDILDTQVKCFLFKA